MKLSCKDVMSRLGCKDVSFKYVTKMEAKTSVDKVRAAVVGATLLLGVISLLSGVACFYGAIAGGAPAVAGAICIILGIALLTISTIWIVKMSGSKVCNCLDGGKK
ncbi:hypothetical protein [Chlamydiifrater phoenicopteri]|uniref:hypothetical protein n=1 Tax=Chlamydiifrater phoenicopteri TaxID=2681469 RepID=UPI001BCDFF10|nr:hypothetical protein [Chlamydiifrater phoenicopteri]